MMPKLYFRRVEPYLYLIVDLVLTQLSLDLAIFLRRQINLGVTIAEAWFFVPDLSLRLVICLTWAFFLSLFAVYSNRRTGDLWVELKALGQALLASLSMLTMAIFLLDYDEFSRLMYFYFAATNAFVLLSMHLGLRAMRALLGKFRQPRRVLIVGTGTQAQTIASILIERGQWYNLAVIGFLSEEHDEVTDLLGRPVWCGLHMILATVTQHDIREVVIALPPQAREKVASLYRTLQDLSVQIRQVPDALDRALMRSALGELAGVELLNLHEPRLQTLDRAISRILDLSLAAVGLLILAPIMLLIAILIKFDSPGPALFRQTRLGKNGHPFTFYKFRTMIHNADSRIHQEYLHKLINGQAERYSDGTQGNGVLKLMNDPRITRMGHFLRKSSLDELPQLFNVLRGEMSLVGPRPPIPYEVEEYQEWHKRRLETVPGITGLWQVSGRSQVSFDEMIQMDIEYIERQSLLLDLKILMLTPRAVILGKGAG